MKKEIDMQEFVQVKTDLHTTKLLKQVGEAIKFEIADGMSNNQINENLDTVINNQNKFPAFIEQLKDQLVIINTRVENVSAHNLSQITSENEANRDIIIKQIVTLSENQSSQNITLSDIYLLQKNIENNSKPISEIKDSIISNYDDLSEKLQRIIISNEESTQSNNIVLKELLAIKEGMTLNNNEMRKSLDLILSNQDSSFTKIKTIEAIQNKPWYKKIFK